MPRRIARVLSKVQLTSSSRGLLLVETINASLAEIINASSAEIILKKTSDLLLGAEFSSDCAGSFFTF